MRICSWRTVHAVSLTSDAIDRHDDDDDDDIGEDDVDNRDVDKIFCLRSSNLLPLTF